MAEDRAAVEVLSNEEVCAGVRCLRFHRPWSFVPGQSVGITTDPEIVPRLYSIASAPEASCLEIVYDVLATGVLTPILSRARAGTTIDASGPFGSFRDASRPSVWIATGTGIAPFVSMARSGVTDDRWLIHGSRTVDGLLYRELLTATLGGNYIACCSRESVPGVYSGRLTAHLEEADLRPDRAYLLCGGPSMIVDVREILLRRRIPFDRIVSEVYF